MTTAVYRPRFPHGRESGRNVPVWYGSSSTESDENKEQARALPMPLKTRSGLPKHPRTPVSSPSVFAGQAADRAITQSIGDMRGGHGTNHPPTCANTEGRRSR